jgi:hypothetical protein
MMTDSAPKPSDETFSDEQLRSLSKSLLSAPPARPSALDDPEGFIRYCYRVAVSEPQVSEPTTPPAPLPPTRPKGKRYGHTHSVAWLFGGVAVSILAFSVGYLIRPKPEREIVYVSRSEGGPSTSLEVREVVRPRPGDRPRSNEFDPPPATITNIIFRLPSTAKSGFVYGFTSDGTLQSLGQHAGDGTAILGTVDVESADVGIFMILNTDDTSTVPSDLKTWLTNTNTLSLHELLWGTNPNTSFDQQLTDAIRESSQWECPKSSIVVLRPLKTLHSDSCFGLLPRPHLNK